ncbi:hypothetical protein CCZ01_07835 [Helicobacter monodelphidis]|uniref:hypothetical protein n=1 Tax=Helicobacter sp. 15-1451 TaxID=2004995 RepID=UPI000DCF396E|nr:hypothetical protein [Helicobacter sp. 15-1451]RAX56954.1 hypothetical protein CCZ01_07835 [Helicobacter sp. 15-1451]
MTRNEFEKKQNEASENLIEIDILAREIGEFYFEGIEDLESRTHLYALLDFFNKRKRLLAETDLTFDSHLFQLQKDGILEKIIDFLKQKRSKND